MNIGVRPTFNGQDQTLEVHLFDFNENIYGKTIEIQFVERIRDEKEFSGVEELVEQLNEDKQAAQKILQE